MAKSANRAVDASTRRKKGTRRPSVRFRLAPPLFDAGGHAEGVVQADAIAGNNNAINNKTGTGRLGGPTARIMPGMAGHRTSLKAMEMTKDMSRSLGLSTLKTSTGNRLQLHS